MPPQRDTICAVVIDDDRDVLDLVEWRLQQTGLHVEVLSFSCPQEAVDFFERIAQSDFPIPDPTIVFCDIRMPKLSGFDVIERIRSIRKFDGIRIYVITSSTLQSDRLRAVEVGADGHLAKFPTADEFARVLETV